MQDDVAKLLRQVVAQAQQARLMSLEHFSVDGTLIAAQASLKSFKPNDAGAEREARATRHHWVSVATCSPPIFESAGGEKGCENPGAPASGCWRDRQAASS